MNKITDGDFDQKSLVNIISKLKSEEQNCKNIQDFLNLAFSFNFKGVTITPFQKKLEIEQVLKGLEIHRPKRILEIGTANGGTLYLLSKILSKSGTIISIDMPGGEFGGEYYPEWRERIYKEFVNDEQKIFLIRKNSHDENTFESVRNVLNNQKIDVIFIDGDHSFDGVKKDFEMYSKLLDKSGIIIFHDINNAEESKVGKVPEFWNYIKKRYQTIEIKENEEEGYGSGILFYHQEKENLNDKFEKTLKIIDEVKRKQTEEYLTKIIDNPLGILLSTYSKRKDLQERFPDVVNGHYDDLINWAFTVLNNDDLRKDLDPKLSKFQLWYNTYLEEKIRNSESNVSLENEKVRNSELNVSLENEKVRNSELNVSLEDEKVRNSELNVSLEDKKVRNSELIYNNFTLKESLDNITNSLGWKFIVWFRYEYNKKIPVNSKSRKLIDSFISKIILKYSRKQIIFQQPNIIKEKSVQNQIQVKINLGNIYNKWKKQTLEIYQNGKNKKTFKENETTIIIPVFNNSKVVIPCIQSIIHNTDSYKILIIDDSSTEKELLKFYKKIQKDSNVKIILNKKNQGYVKNINLGIKKSNKDDIVLLNSDTIVTKNWLTKIHKCAYSNSGFGIVSPFSNNATLCSIPEFMKPNQIPRGFTIEEFAEVVEKTPYDYPILPTAVGFCMFIKRKVIEEIGFFDEEFSPAYEEENDFCMRALKHGFVVALDNKTFVYHEGKSSYKETTKLQEDHLKLMLKKHPEYLEIVSNFCSENSLSRIHESINYFILSKNNNKFKNVLTVLHGPIYSKNPGGTENFCRSLYEKIEGYSNYLMYPENNSIIIEESNSEKRKQIYKFKRDNQNLDLTNCTDAEREFFIKILGELNVGLVHFQHLLFLPLSLFQIVKEMKIHTILNLHDFYYFCPRIYLFENGKYEGFCNATTDLERCDRCLEPIGYPKGYQEKWRGYGKFILENVDTIIAPTQSTLDLYKKVFDINWEKSKIISHGIYSSEIDTFSTNPETPLEKIKVGFIGALIADRKGREIILEILKTNKDKRIEWHFFGRESNLSKFTKSENEIIGKIINHGGWSDSVTLSKVLRDNQIQLVILPSQECYSLVLSDVWNARIPVIVPDLVALGERVKNQGAGWVYPFPSTATNILKIIDKILTTPEEYNNKIKDFDILKVKTITECVKEYQNIYDGFFEKIS